MHGGPPPQASHGVMPVQAAGIFLSGFSRTRSIGCPYPGGHLVRCVNRGKTMFTSKLDTCFCPCLPAV